MVDKNEKALISGNEAKVSTKGGGPEKGKHLLLQAALSSASFSGHQTVLETLPVGGSAFLLSNERQKLR